MTNVKWLARITVLEQPFAGYQQTRGYRLRATEDDPGVAVTRMMPRSLLAPPGVPDFMTRRRYRRGRAGRAGGPRLVGVGADRRPSRSAPTTAPPGRRAALGDAPGEHAWRHFTATWAAEPGEHVLCVPRRDAAGQRDTGGAAVERRRLREQRRPAGAGDRGMTESPRDDRISGLLLIAALTALMWVVEVVNAIDNYRLDSGGIQPREIDGLDGIVWAPFLHASWGHLIGNTVPFVILGVVIALGGLVRVALVTLIVAGIGGLGVWLFGPGNTVHVGASGVVFGYAGYLVARGFFSRSVLHLATGALVAVIWGGTLVASLVPRDGISWQGHLFGGIGGIVAARLLAPRPAEGAKPPGDPLGARP